MKSLILMNPVRRRRRKLAGAALAAHQRKAGRRSRRTTSRRRVSRRIRRNPPTVARRRSGPSAAVRRKISLAVKRANRHRASRPIRSRARAIIRRVRSGGFRSLRRRSFRRSGGSGGSRGLLIKTLFSRQTLMTAGGAIGASFLTSWLLRTYGAKLPMSNNMWGRIGYKLAIPFAAAYGAKKFARQHDLANGLIIGGVVMAVNELIASIGKPAGAVAGVSGPADYASHLIAGLDEVPEFSEDPDSLGEYFDADVDPLYSNTPAFNSSFA